MRRIARWSPSCPPNLVVEAQLLYPSLLRSGNEAARRLANELLDHDHGLELGLSKADKGGADPDLRRLFEAHVGRQDRAFQLLSPGTDGPGAGGAG